MKLTEIIHELNLADLTPELSKDREVQAGYASDVLSDIIVHARNGGVLVTFQVHMYAVAVAVQARFDAVIFSLGRKPEKTIIAKAVQEGISLFSSEQLSFDIVGRLYQLGLRGAKERRH